MKIFWKIPRNLEKKQFVWQEKLNNYEEVKTIEPIEAKEVKLTVEQELAKKHDNEKVLNQSLLDRQVLAIKNNFPCAADCLKNVPLSDILERSPEELQLLFIVDGKIDFRGNSHAKRQIGLSDLFPKISDNQQFVVLDGVPYAYGARRPSDGKIGYGNPKYKAIFGGETIEFFIKEPQEENDKQEENYTSFVKNDKGETVAPSEDYSYDKLTENFAKYEDNLENLTVEEEKEEKEDFREKTKYLETVATLYQSSESNLQKIEINSASVTELAKKLDIDANTIKAVIAVESSGNPRATRFEPHIYSRALNGEYGLGDPKKLATSHGLFQIMGFNYEAAGFGSVEEMVTTMQTSEGQLKAFGNFVLNNPKIHRALKNKNWEQFARYYNGPKYYQNRYDTKIAAAFNKFSNDTENFA